MKLLSANPGALDTAAHRRVRVGIRHRCWMPGGETIRLPPTQP